jgi:hypothetical protein
MIDGRITIRSVGTALWAACNRWNVGQDWKPK